MKFEENCLWFGSVSIKIVNIIYIFSYFPVVRSINIRAMSLDMLRTGFQRVDEDIGASEVLHRHLHHTHRIAGYHDHSVPWLRISSYGEHIPAIHCEIIFLFILIFVIKVV